MDMHCKFRWPFRATPRQEQPSSPSKPRWEGIADEIEQRFLATLKALMDGLFLLARAMPIQFVVESDASSAFWKVQRPLCNVISGQKRPDTNLSH